MLTYDSRLLEVILMIYNAIKTRFTGISGKKPWIKHKCSITLFKGERRKGLYVLHLTSPKLCDGRQPPNPAAEAEGPEQLCHTHVNHHHHQQQQPHQYEACFHSITTHIQPGPTSLPGVRRSMRLMH